MPTAPTVSSALSLLPARVRQLIYVVYGVLVVVASSAQVGYASVVGLDQPRWLTVTLAVIGFLAVPVSALAATNVGQGNLPSSQSPDVVAYQTPSGLVVAGAASPIPTGTPVDVSLNSDLEIGDELSEDAAYELHYSGHAS